MSKQAEVRRRGVWTKTNRGGRGSPSKRRPLVLALIGGALLLAACSRSGDLSGDFYYTTRGGDVKRFADHEIVLVKATPKFETAWQETIAGFKSAYEPVKAEYEEASRREGEAREASYRSLADSIASRSLVDSSYRRRHDEAQALTQAARDRSDEVLGTWRSHALKLIAWGKAAETRTNAAGRFEFRGVAAGRYYLFATAEVPILLSSLQFVRVHWWVPVEVKSGAQTLDLTMNNVGGWPFH
jgi:hypothetical protein